MNRTYVLVGGVVLAVTALVAVAFAMGAPPKPADNSADIYSGKFFKAEESITTGSVTTAGTNVSYQAIAGTLVVHDKDWNDAAQSGGDKNPDAKADSTSPEASMFSSIMPSAAQASRIARSRFSTMAGPVPRPFGCIWAPSVPSAW